jgi:transposase
MQYDDLSLTAEEIGPVPVIRRVFDRIDLERLLGVFVPERRLGRPPAVSHAKTLTVMIFNILLSREPLYAVRGWLSGWAIEHFGLTETEAGLVNDDRIARALDRLYEIDPASFVTELVTRAVREFEIDLEQIHNDTTTVTFSGAYEGQKNKDELQRPPRITFGYNKDHRPDLKQLVYSLTISADGAVPVHYKTYDGNTTDDQTHIQTWNAVRKIRGNADFMYVADSKLCTKENMKYIDGEGGRFLTVLPRSRREDDDFRELLQRQPVPWEEVRRRPHPRNRQKPDCVYQAYEWDRRSAEGYRVIWYVSSVKAAEDQKRRARRILRAHQRVEELEARTGAHRFRSVESARKAAEGVLQEEGAERWLAVHVHEEKVSDFKQTTPGRPGKETKYRKIDYPIILFEVEELAEVIQGDAKCDGLFAMVTNADDDGESTPKDFLDIYKYQPFLEKRNEQLKSVLDVAPMWLKKPERVAALLFVYFIAVLLMALIEREVRNQMRANDIESLPLYPEERLCKAPTLEVIFKAFSGIRRSHLLDANGNAVKTFYDQLSPVAEQLLVLLGVNRSAYAV